MAEISQEANASLTQATDSMPVGKATGAPRGDTRPVYEIGYHLVPTLAEEQLASEVAKIRSTLGNAEIIKDEAPRKINFAYMIERAGAGRREKYTEGYFGFIKFATDKENIPAVEQALRAERSVLRHLLVETMRDEAVPARRAVFSSDRLEGATIKKPAAPLEEAKGGEV